MNIRMIKEVLEEISTPTGISYSGDRTLSKGEVKCILDYIEELQQERNQFKEYTNHNYDEGKKKQQRIDKAIDKIQLLIDLGFDYDGFNQVDSLKGLIDELVSLARESRNILKGSGINE